MYACCLISLLFHVILRHGVDAETLRIMPMGDALTVGYSKVPGAYRIALSNKLSQMQYTFQFVGNERSANMQHEGHKSFDIARMTDHVDEFLDAHDPDIILVLIGCKDLLEESTFGEAADRYNRLIEKIASSRPQSHILVGNLPPRKEEDRNRKIEELFNPRIPTIVSGHQSAGRLVDFVDVNSVVRIDHLATNLQPSVEGYANIGNAFASAIAKVVSPNLAGMSRAILRVEGGLDRRHITVTFTRPYPPNKGIPESFSVNKELTILGAEFIDEERRMISLTTSEQAPGETYQLSVLQAMPGINKRDFSTGWRMLVLADWHLGEKYVFVQNQKQISNDVKIIQYLKERYEGEVLMIPGDTNAGFWDTDRFLNDMRDFLGSNISRENAVLEAGDRCYTGLLSSFRFGGYPNVLVAIGDHELGDNSWDKYSNKSRLQPHFRQTFASNFNYNYKGRFKYTEKIGNAYARPLGTKYEETSFAHVHKNTLIVTVDVLYQHNYFVDVGPYGTVTGEVNGDHLQWLDSVLEEGSKLLEVKHIIVQGHFPALFPVRKTKSSGIYMDNNENSDFWKVLRKHPVDLYFAGEAHLNTVTKDAESEIIQVVSRGNFFSNFLTIDFADDAIDITSYTESGVEKTMSNFDYDPSGRIKIRKQDGSKIVSASGDLSILRSNDPVMYFNFERKAALKDRPVLGLGELPGARRSPTVDSVEVGGTLCTDTLVNSGLFGQDYDAQSKNVDLTSGVYGLAGEFTSDSRAAVFGMGPHSGSHPISYALWFKSTSFGARILLSYEGYWNQAVAMNLRLRNGKPEIVYSASQKIIVKNLLLNDGGWHHIAVSMPFNGCRLSEIKFYIDGEDSPTHMVGIDSVVDLPNGGMISIGSFGHGGIGNEFGSQRDGFLTGLNFEGSFDDIMIFARPLSKSEVKNISSTSKSFALRSKVSYVRQEALCLGFDLFGNGVVLRSCTDGEGQQWIQDALGYIHNKLRYDKCLVPDDSTSGSMGLTVKECNDRVDSSFSWTLNLDTISNSDTNKVLIVDTNMNNSVVLSSSISKESLLPEHTWDIVYEGGFASSHLTGTPSVSPTTFPTSVPSVSPSSIPSTNPTSSPTSNPSSLPSTSPSVDPTSFPTSTPSNVPTVDPSVAPSHRPSTSPSSLPSITPSDKPSNEPSISLLPTASSKPTARICEDGEGSVFIKTGKEKTCQNARQNAKQCRYEILRRHCPVSCNICHTGAPTAAPKECKDSSTKFELFSGKKKTCRNASNNANLCQKAVVKENCPLTCNVCDFPSQAPSKAPTCEDSTEDLVMRGTGVIRTCGEAINRPALCGKEIFQKECPVSCNSCDLLQSDQDDGPSSCMDNAGKIVLPNGLKKSCWQARKKEELCTKYSVVRDHCPQTCEVCD